MTSPCLPKDRASLAHRATCFTCIWLFKITAGALGPLITALDRPPPKSRPTLIKKYPCRPRLKCRIFYPPNHKSGTRLPVYFNIHGGAFVAFDASADDRFCASWAERTGMLVVSMNYTKAPSHVYPAATLDIQEVALAALDDEDLPIDRARVVMGGFSAGGQLALSASQLPGLKGVVKAAVVYYPVVDFGHTIDYKMGVRPYVNGPPDFLETAIPWVEWAFISPGQDLCHPMLSPFYAKKEDLPPHLYVIGAEYDILRMEAQDMIHRLAETGEQSNQKDDFERGNYKWTLARDCVHGFTHNGPEAASRPEPEPKSQSSLRFKMRSKLGLTPRVTSASQSDSKPGFEPAPKPESKLISKLRAKAGLKPKSKPEPKPKPQPQGPTKTDRIYEDAHLWLKKSVLA